MAKPRAFISFDYENDENLKQLLVGQARNPDSPFDIQDWSVKEPMAGDWKEKVRARIRQTDLTIVICGHHTDQATGVSVELNITREEGNPYFLLQGHPNGNCRKPASALPSDKMYKWTWENLRRLLS